MKVNESYYIYHCAVICDIATTGIVTYDGNGDQYHFSNGSDGMHNVYIIADDYSNAYLSQELELKASNIEEIDAEDLRAWELKHRMDELNVKQVAMICLNKNANASLVKYDSGSWFKHDDESNNLIELIAKDHMQPIYLNILKSCNGTLYIYVK